MHNLISINDLSKEQILKILTLTHEFKNGLSRKTLTNKIIASCFFESSTRTRLSFDAAVKRLGGDVIGFDDSNSTSLSTKGESLVDTLKIISAYADALIIRHPEDGAARLAKEVCGIPVINAGDGSNQHPSQTLLDLFSILDTQGKLENINLGIMGDLKHSRTVHSLIAAASLFGMGLFLIAPQGLRLAELQLTPLKTAGTQYSFHTDVSQVIDKLDVLYVTRPQKERFLDDNIDINYGITMAHLNNVKPNFKIMHPLPRQSEIPNEIDNTPYAYYFTQAKNGLFVRQALLDILFT